MLRIAVQSKGRLNEDTMLLLQEAGIKLVSDKRTLLVPSKNFPLEILFLRDDDIPQSVATGVADVGVVGENEFREKGKTPASSNAWDSVSAVFQSPYRKPLNTRDPNG